MGAWAPGRPVLLCSNELPQVPMWSCFAIFKIPYRHNTIVRSGLPSARPPSPSQGSNATGDCCSKCFNEMNTNNTQGTATPAPVATPAPAPVIAASPAPAPVVAKPVACVTTETQPAIAPSPTKKKKKKKKVNYRNMIAGMMEQNGARDTNKEKESIQKVTGGGAFVKVDKI